MEIKNNKDKKIFRAVFSLEYGGGCFDVEAFDKNQALDILVSLDDEAERKIKTFLETIRN